MALNKPLYFVGVAQPGDQRSSKPGYAGSLLRPAEKRYAADRLSAVGADPARACPLVIDHAGLSAPGQTLAADKRIGHVTDVLVDDAQNVLAVGEIYGSRPESRALLENIQRGGKWGLSFFTEFEQDPATLDVHNIKLSHLGVTMDPAWGAEGSWIYEVTDNKAALDRVLRERYLARKDVYASEATRARYVPAASLTLVPKIMEPFNNRTQPSGQPPRATPAPSAPAPSRPSWVSSFTRAMADVAVSSPAAAPVAAAPEPMAVVSDAAAPAAAAAAAPAVEAPPRAVTEVLREISQAEAQVKSERNPLARLRGAQQLADQIAKEVRSGPFSLLTLAKELAPTIAYLDNEIKALSVVHKPHLAAMAKEKIISPDTAGFIDSMMLEGMRSNDKNMGRVCEYARLLSFFFAAAHARPRRYVAAMAEETTKSQKNWEAKYEQAKQLADMAEQRKRERDELAKKHESLQQEFNDHKKRLVELESNLAKLTPAAAAAAGEQQAAAAAAAAPTPAPASGTPEIRLVPGVTAATSSLSTTSSLGATSAWNVHSDGILGDKEQFLATLKLIGRRPVDINAYDPATRDRTGGANAFRFVINDLKQ